MERIFGETLAAVIKREKRLAPQTAADWFDQALEGLKAAHQAGVIHRDLKPENLLISKIESGQQHVRVLDFGLAKVTTHSPTVAGSITTPGTVMGTLGYMSVEQLTGAAVDSRSDLFSVGVMVIEALTGLRPFNGKTYHELLTAMLNETYRLPDE